ncbi:MAG: RNA-protein complex protein Nop10 [Candidatus Thorarchaeota archaeon]|nr:MAG: RNA-protein complex protein Nop10 [Candidatus Thorarchaeota archaeon]
MTHLYKCIECNYYTLENNQCPKCGGSVKDPAPARFSPQDKYGEYRRKAKRRLRTSSEVD